MVVTRSRAPINVVGARGSEGADPCAASERILVKCRRTPTRELVVGGLLVVSDQEEAEVNAALAGLEQKHQCKIAVLRISLSQMMAEVTNASPFWRDLLRGSLFSLATLEPLVDFLQAKTRDA